MLVVALLWTQETNDERMQRSSFCVRAREGLNAGNGEWCGDPINNKARGRAARNCLTQTMFVETPGPSEASQLDGLPDAQRAETKEILDEIARDEAPADTTPPAPKPADDKKPDEAKPEEKKPDQETPKPPESVKRPRLMPAWAHEAAKNNWEKREGELLKELETLKAGKGPESKDTQPTPEQQETLERDIDELVKAHPGISKELAKSLVELGMKHGGKIPADITEKLKEVDSFRAQREAQAEEQAYNAAFDKEVLPLIKAEFGESVAQDTIQEIRSKMLELAYSDNFAQTPLPVIFKGVDEFRTFKRPPAASAERSQGGAERQAGAEGDDSEFTSVTDEDIEKMDSKTFDRYTTWAEKNEKAKR